MAFRFLTPTLTARLIVGLVVLSAGTSGALADYPLVHQLQAPDAQAEARFGGSVAGLGNRILVGAQYHDIEGIGNDAGQAYLFGPDGTHLHTFQAPDARTGARFGYPIRGWNDNVLIGAHFHDIDGIGAEAGQAYLFNASGGHRLTLQAPDAQGGARFGGQLTNVGEGLLLIGANTHNIGGVGNRAGQAYLFDINGTHLHTLQAPDAQADAWFGGAVAGVGDTILIGATAHAIDGVGDRAGQAYLFDLEGNHLHTLQAPDAQAGARFGSVAAVKDRIVVGAHHHSISGVGDDAGQAYLFDNDGNHLVTLQAPDARPSAEFGRWIVPAGEHILIGAAGHAVDGLSDAGQAYLFDLDGDLLHTFQAPDVQADDWFGRAVGMTQGHVIIGANAHHLAGIGDNAGQVYVFVPEPSSILLLAIGSIFVLRRSRRCSDVRPVLRASFANDLGITAPADHRPRKISRCLLTATRPAR